MAGERYASITIRAALSHNDNVRGTQTTQFSFGLGATTIQLYRGGQPGQFIVPDPDDFGVGESYGLQAIQNMLAVLGPRLFALNLPYTLSTPKQVGTKASFYDKDKEAPVIEFTITAAQYGAELSPLSFDPHYNDLYFPDAFQVTANVGNISPLLATATVTHTGIYGSKNGVIELTVTSPDGDTPFVTYAWSDGATTPGRTGLSAGTYQCLLTSSTGASTTVTATVLSDPELLVAVASTPNSISLTASGGVAPYAYAWADGATTAARTQLPGGTYRCTVTDAHGASQQVEVTLSVAGRYWFSGNAIPLSLLASSKDVVAFRLQVWLEQDYLSGDFQPVGPALEQPADAGGRTTFEVQQLLEPYVAPPVPGGAGVTLATGLFKRFYLQHHERTATGASRATTLSPAYLVHGGLDYQQAALGTWFSSYQAAQLPFLTWEPATKKVLPDQPEYLYFMALADLPDGFTVRLRFYWPDGSQDESTLAGGPAALAYEVFSVGVGPLAVGLDYHETRKQQPCRRYDIRVLDAAGALLSETRTFVPDHRPCAVRRYFLYANSLGGWNTLVCRGRASQELATKTQAADNGRPAGYDPLRGDYTISQRTGLATLKCYTGARSSAQLAADRDFLLSERVLLLAGGRYLAGQVRDGKTVVFDEDETRRLVQFDFELPRERFYSAAL